MPRFRFDVDDECKEDELKTRSFQAKRTRYTSTRFTLEDSVDDYCFEHGIPKLSHKETLASSAEPPDELKGVSQLVVPKKRKASIAVRDEIDRLALLLEAAVYVSDRQYHQTAEPDNISNTPVATLSSADRSRIQAEVKVLQERSDDRNRRNESKIKSLIDASLAAAEEVRAQQAKEQKENDAREKAEAEARGRAEAEAKEKAEAEAKARVETAAPAVGPETESSEPRASPRSARDPAAASITLSEPSRESSSRSNYIEKAKKLTRSLISYKQSADTFANSSAKQRRLAMKKLVIRSLNTLTQDDLVKNSHNASALAQAIISAQSEDEQIKAQNQSQPELARGKRFLINLLAGDVIKRVQAEGFNGTRGDGFVLAATVAAISVAAKDIVAVLTAHIYTVCPLAIPKLPSENTDEVAFMKELGMLQDDKGEFETFERYLSRTESIISLVADIMASVPEEHTLLDGNPGAVPWLQRFLSALPANGTLPIFVAPVLTGFLTGAGHMLANAYTDDFKKILEKIDKEIVPRLDTTAAGAPSATRLTQTLEGGIGSFASTLPPKAIPSLYFGAVASAGNSFAAASSSPVPRQSSAPSSSFSLFGPSNPQRSSGQFASTQANSNPFGGTTSNVNQGTSNNGKQPCRFFAEGNCRYGDKCKFSHETQSGFGTSSTAINSSTFGSQPSVAPSPFGATTAPTPTPFGGNAPSPFGQSTAPSPFGSTAAPTPNAFGSTTAPTPSPFGAGPAPTPSPFGAGPAPTPSPFGVAATPGPTRFSGNVPNRNPFGTGNTPTQASFGTGTIPTSSPFGAGVAPPTPSPFGTGTAPSTFGAGVTPAPSPFGASATHSPFGGGNTTAFGGNSSFGAPVAPVPSPFGNQAQTQFGGIAPTPSPFGTSAPPFGGATAPAPFGGSSSTAPPFGATAPATFGASQSTLFGKGTQSPFGTTAPSQPFGAPTPSPFGNSQPFGSSTPAPFGTAPNPSTFASSSANNASPFGSAAAPSPSPFSAAPTAFGTQPSNPSLFGAAPAPFGSPTPTPSPFSVPTPSPFGAPTPSPFGTATTSTPFGGTAPVSNTFGSSPFGSSGPAPSAAFGASAFGSSAPFGNSSTTGIAAAPTPFGGSTGFRQQNNNNAKKQPCKFFAQGNCRFGTNCRFSHETQNSSPFGSYRR